MVLGGLVLRATDGNNHLLARYYAGAMTIFRNQGGTWTVIASAPLTVALGTTHRIAFSGAGSTLTVTWDGATLLTATEAFNQTATKHGLIWAPFVDTLSAYDNFRTTTP
jgi:hypothetical protein